MLKVQCPKSKDKEELNSFFKAVITDTINKEGIEDLSLIEEEVEDKNQCLEEYFCSEGKDRFFLMAVHKGNIVGTISYGSCNELAVHNSNGELCDIGEIGTVYVRPEYQNKGVASVLLNAMYIALKSRGIKEFCLDSGYKKAQRFWERRLGEPKYVAKDFWEEGAHHMMWRNSVDDLEREWMVNVIDPQSKELD